MFAGFEVVVDQYCFHKLISTALANSDTYQSTCVGSVLRNGTDLWLLHVSRPMALAWPGQTLVLGYISGCKQLRIMIRHWLDFKLYCARRVNFVLALFPL